MPGQFRAAARPGDCGEPADLGKRRRRCREFCLRHGEKTVLDIGTEHFEHFKIQLHCVRFNGRAMFARQPIPIAPPRSSL
jgi:hypothetical protein